MSPELCEKVLFVLLLLPSASYSSHVTGEKTERAAIKRFCAYSKIYNVIKEKRDFFSGCICFSQFASTSFLQIFFINNVQ